MRASLGAITTLIILVAMARPGITVSQQQAAPAAAPAQAIKLLHNEVDAVGWAFAALLEYPESERPFVRFVYIPPWGDAHWIDAVDFAVNAACSHTRNLVKARLHGKGWLLGYNLQELAPNPTELAQLVETWDALAASDDTFHVSQVNIQEVVVTVNVDQRDPRTGKTVQVPQQQTQQVSRRISVLAPHLQDALARHATDAEKSQRVDVLLAQLTTSTGGIYPADFMLEQLLTSVRGKYPEFRQMPGFVADRPGETGSAFQRLLARRGFYLEQSRDLSGDKGALLLISGVTGKSRIIMTTFGLASRQPMAVTFDFKDSRVRPDQQFIRNLIQFDPLADAKEAFLPMPNGLVEYVLADSSGNLQRSAPPDIVADSTKPDGHTKELEMGMSCIICHAPEDGYKTARNDMEFFQGADLDFFGDSTGYTNAAGQDVALTRAEAVAIVAGRYGERIDDPDGVLGRARRDLDRTIDTLTSYQTKALGEHSTQLLGAKIKEIYHGYRYRTIDAERACLELSVEVPAGRGREVFRQLVPPPNAGESEDVVIALLRNGATIKRDDFSAIRPELARRAQLNRNSLKE